MAHEENIATTWFRTLFASLVSPSSAAEETTPLPAPVEESTVATPSTFTTSPGPRVPVATTGTRIGHPLLCRDVLASAPEETSGIGMEEFTADFDCRLQIIEGSICDGRLEEASRRINELNATWRRFNSAHSEIPQADRSRLLGRLYLAQASLERARGPHREAYALHYEARGAELIGEHARARLRYREFLATDAATSPARTRGMSEMVTVSVEHQRTLELEAVDRLTETAGSILQQRQQRLLVDAVYGMGEHDHSIQFLGGLRRLIASGRADTIDEAIDVLRENYLRSRREFEAHPTVSAGMRVEGWPELTSVRLEGGTYTLSAGGRAPRASVITVGREGGVICLPGAQYYFPPADHELTVRLTGDQMLRLRVDGQTQTVPAVTRGREVVLPGHGYYVADSTHPDADIPREVLDMRLTRHPVYDATEGAQIHPNSLERVFSGSTGDLVVDGFLQTMLEMETTEGLESLTGESTRGDYLISVAQRMRAREGSYGVASACLEEVFAPEFERALNQVLENRSGEESEADLMTRASEQMEAWSESGELAESDPVAARAWAIYNDMLDPTGETFNAMDERQDAMVDEAIVTGITFIPTMGLGSTVAEGVEGIRAVRLAAAAASVGSRRLLMRFGPRIAALGARTAYGAVIAAPAITGRVAFEAPVMTLSSAALMGRPMDDETAVAGSLTTGAHLMVYHTVGAALPRPLRFLAESYLGQDLGEYAAGSATRRMGLRLYFHGASSTAMTGLGTGLSYSDSSDNRTFIERIAGEGFRMGCYMAFLGGTAGEEPRTRSVLERLRSSDVLANLRMREGDFTLSAARFESFPELRPLSDALRDPAAVAAIRREVRTELGGRYESMAQIRSAIENALRRRGFDANTATDRLYDRALAGEITLQEYSDLGTLANRHFLLEFFPDEVPLFRVTAPEHAGLPGRSRVSGSDWGVGESAGPSTAEMYMEDGMILIRSTLGDVRRAGGSVITDMDTVSGSGALTVAHPDGAPMPFERVELPSTEPSVETSPTLPPSADTPRGTPRAIPEPRPTSGALPRSATAVGVAIRHANAHLSDVTGFRFAIESSLVAPGNEMGVPPEVEVRVTGPEAELSFLEALRNVSESVTIENLGDGRYRVHDERRGDSIVTVRRGLELNVEHQTDLGEWLNGLPPAEREGLRLSRYTDAVFGDLIRHLRDAGWEIPDVKQFVLYYGGEGMRPRLDEVLSQPLGDAAQVAAAGR